MRSWLDVEEEAQKPELSVCAAVLKARSTEWRGLALGGVDLPTAALS
jgi:hypothetical protein